MPRNLDVLAVVAAGGALGGSARYGLSRALPSAPPGFPTATLTVNLIGAALIGVVAVLVLEKRPPHRLVRPFVVTGLLGGFTTFSALSVETVRLIDVDAVGIAVAYVSLTVVLGLLLVRLAVVVTRAMVIGRPATGRDSSGGSWE